MDFLSPGAKSLSHCYGAGDGDRGPLLSEWYLCFRSRVLGGGSSLYSSQAASAGMELPAYMWAGVKEIGVLALLACCTWDRACPMNTVWKKERSSKSLQSPGCTCLEFRLCNMKLKRMRSAGSLALPERYHSPLLGCRGRGSPFLATPTWSWAFVILNRVGEAAGLGSSVTNSSCSYQDWVYFLE